MHRNSMNKVILVGRIGQEPEKRSTQAGTAVSNFSVATNETMRDQSGQTTELTEWHRCVAFGKTAEFVNSYVNKGRLVYVDGRLKTRKWTDNNNQTRYSTEINVDTVMMLDKRDSGSYGGDIEYDQSSRSMNSGGMGAGNQGGGMNQGGAMNQPGGMSQSGASKMNQGGDIPYDSQDSDDNDLPF